MIAGARTTGKTLASHGAVWETVQFTLQAGRRGGGGGGRGGQLPGRVGRCLKVQPLLSFPSYLPKVPPVLLILVPPDFLSIHLFAACLRGSSLLNWIRHIYRRFFYRRRVMLTSRFQLVSGLWSPRVHASCDGGLSVCFRRRCSPTKMKGGTSVTYTCSSWKMREFTSKCVKVKNDIQNQQMFLVRHKRKFLAVKSLKVGRHEKQEEATP